MKKFLYAAVCMALVLTFIAAAVPYIPAEAASEFFSTAELVEIKSHIEKDVGMGNYATVQGGCTDGKYAYFAVQGGSTVILKYDMNNWKLTKKATVGGLGHANDITYNSKKKYLVVANNYSSEDILTLVDPNSLKAIGTVEPKREKTEKELKKEEEERKKEKENEEDSGEDSEEQDEEIDKYKRIKVYSIAYCPSKNCYAAGLSGSYDYALLDENFEMISKYEGSSTGYTRQGCDCDDNYVYFSQSGGSNAVVVYDFSGNYAGSFSLGHSHEVENIFHVGNSFYLTLHYYGNSIHRAGFSERTKIRFNVKYDSGGGFGVMADTSVHYGEDTPLSKCTFTKPGYFFGGWRISREYDGKIMGMKPGSAKREWLDESELYNYTLYPDMKKVAKLVKFGSAVLTAFWISERYDISYSSDGGEGWMPFESLEYAEEYTMPKNEFVHHGYVFSGYTAVRDYDGRAYGFRRGSDSAEWLDIDDMEKPYLFSEGEKVSKLTYDGTVTMTARFSLAYQFDDSGERLLRYIGIDKTADIPDSDGRLNTIAQGAFSDNEYVEEIIVPQSVDVMESGAVSGCEKLKAIYFSEHFPNTFDKDCVSGSGSPMIYEVRDDIALCMGFYVNSYNAVLIRLSADAFERWRSSVGIE